MTIFSTVILGLEKVESAPWLGDHFINFSHREKEKYAGNFALSAYLCLV